MEDIYLTFFMDKMATTCEAIEKKPSLSFYLKEIKREIETVNEHIKNPTEFENENRLNFSTMSFQFIGCYAMAIRKEFPEFLELNPDADWEGFENIGPLVNKKPLCEMSYLKEEVFPKIKHDFENLILPRNVKNPNMIFKIWFYLRTLKDRRNLIKLKN